MSDFNDIMTRHNSQKEPKLWSLMYREVQIGIFKKLSDFFKNFRNFLKKRFRKFLNLTVSHVLSEFWKPKTGKPVTGPIYTLSVAGSVSHNSNIRAMKNWSSWNKSCKQLWCQYYWSSRFSFSFSLLHYTFWKIDFTNMKYLKSIRQKTTDQQFFRGQFL